MILLSGAAGKTGRAVMKALVRQGAPVRALVRGREQRQIALELGAAEALAGDMREPEVWRQALAGIEAVYHMCPNMAPAEAEIGSLVLDAAQAAGVRHLVYHSVLHPQTEGMPHHWQKLRVEEALLTSGLPFTILQPAPYMQNVLAGREAIACGTYAVPYNLDTRLSLVDLADVGEAAAIVLTQPGHHYATYQLASLEAPTQREVASMLGEILGRPVRAEQTDLAAWERQGRQQEMAEYPLATLAAMFRYYDRYGLQGNGNILHWLLGRPPGTFRQFLQRELAAFG